MALELNAKKRDDFTSSTTKKLRKQGSLPAIFYGNGSSQPIFLDRMDFVKTVREGGINGVINLKIGKKSHSAMVQDVQIDRIKDQIIHADFREIDLNQETDADVPVHLVGEAIGAKEGGVVQHFLHDITVRALPASIPSEIVINIEGLNISDAITVADVQKNSSYDILTDPEEVIVSMAPPTEEPEEEKVEEGEQEPERVGENEDSDENPDKNG